MARHVCKHDHEIQEEQEEEDEDKVDMPESEDEDMENNDVSDEQNPEVYILPANRPYPVAFSQFRYIK